MWCANRMGWTDSPGTLEPNRMRPTTVWLSAFPYVLARSRSERMKSFHARFFSGQQKSWSYKMAYEVEAVVYLTHCVQDSHHQYISQNGPLTDTHRSHSPSRTPAPPSSRPGPHSSPTAPPSNPPATSPEKAPHTPSPSQNYCANPQ
jgi:hypothetical protein